MTMTADQKRAASLQKAAAVTHGDVTTTVNRSVALALVELAGLEQDEKGRYGGKYWQLDEALMMALVEIAANDLSR
jgi:hypothetical protein